MAEEYFYGITLDKKEPHVTWEGGNTEEYSNSVDRLLIRQILLDHTAKEGEFNVIEVETMSLHDTIKIPIAVLKIGELRSIQTNLEFADVVTFRLIEGNGPVHILGQHSPVTYEVEDVEELAEEEILSDEEAEEDDQECDNPPKKKMKFPTNKSDDSKTNKANNK